MIIAASVMAFIACEEVDTPAEISIPDAETQKLFNNGISFSPTQASASLSFETTSDWNISVEETKAADWLSVTPSKGSAGTAKVMVSAQSNTGQNLRSAKLTLTCGNVSKSLKVTQEGQQTPPEPVTTIELDQRAMTLAPGEAGMLLVTITTDDPVAPQLTWSSSNTRVATVMPIDDVSIAGIWFPCGLVTAVAEGEAVITAKAGDATATCKVDVVNGIVEVTEITLDQQEVHMSPGQTVQLTATVKPDEAAATAQISWSSSNTDVATVDEEGKVTANDVTGETFIKASVGDKSASCLVKVESEVAIESITLNEVSLTLKEGETFQLTATLHPETATPKPIVWTSSIPAVATVDENGLVTAVRKGGPAMIWAIVNKDTYQEKAVKCEVTVTSDAPAVESIAINPSPVSLKVGEETLLTATITPDGTGAAIEWKSEDPNIVQISKISDTQAKIMGMAAGKTTVLATAGGKFAYCEVTITSGGGEGGSSSLESVSIDPSSVTLSLDEEKVLSLVMVPADADVTIYWVSSESYIASVEMISKTQAKVKGVSAGQTTVTVRAGDKSASCAVTVQGSSGTNIPVESVSLNKTELELSVNQQFQLIATVLPENATEKGVVWTSSVPSSKIYLTVDGMVSALAECEATITARSKDNPYIYATCHVTVTGGGSSGGSGDDVVDLGLSVKWAAWNVGATKPEEYGNHYAWGETATKSSYTSSNYKFGSSYPYSKYEVGGAGTDGKKVLEAEDDAATVNMGSGWRMPTASEWKELREQCTWTWTTRNGVSGMQVTGPSGKSIFLPAAGVYKSTLANKGSYGSYWTASLGVGVEGMAHAVDFVSSDKTTAIIARPYGLSVRAVKD